MEVRLPGGSRHVGEPALRAAVDVPAGTYTLRAEPGAGDAIAHPPAVSLGRVLELAGVAPQPLSFVSIARPHGGAVVLHAPDLALPAPFPDGPPIVWLDGGGVRFLRPVRDDADVNGADNIATTGGDLVVRVQQGPLLDVSVRLSRSRPRARERVELEAHVAGLPEGGAAAVRWRFGDGTTATGAAVAHRWRATGVYSVVAAATGAGGAAGASAPVRVRVGAVRADRGPDGGGSGDRERAPAAGPAQSPGTAPADTQDTTPAPAPATAAPRLRRGTARVPAVRKQRLRAHRRVTSTAATTRVRGVLVATTIPAAAAGAPAAVAAARRGDLPGERDATLVIAAAAACALLALGAARERRAGTR